MEVDPLWEEFREQVAVRCLDGRNGNISGMRTIMSYCGLDRVCIWCGCNLPKDRRRTWCVDKPCGEYAYQRYNWELKRSRFLYDGGRPQACSKCDYVATDLHHIVPISDGGDPYDEDNLVALCNDCHLEVHREINDQKDTKAARKRRKKAEQAEQTQKEATKLVESRQQHDEYWVQFGGIV